MSAIDFIQVNPDFYTERPEVADLWAKVFQQSRRHLERDAYGDLFRKMRPNESEDVKKYREDNYRQLTRSDIDRFISKVSRYFSDSGISLEVSDTLGEWLAEKPFNELGQDMDFEEYLLFSIFTRAIGEPNGLWLAWPHYMEGIPPSYAVADGGLPASEKVPIKSVIIPSEKIVHVSNDIISWFGGTRKIGNQERDFYYIADSENYYWYFPRHGDSPQILEVWYRHALGFVPINFLPGQPNQKSGETYHESFLRPYFEYADEFVNRFSDAQAVWVRHSYPKPVIQELECPECKGQGWTKQDHKCDTCSGTGHIRDIGPYSVLVRPPSSSIEGQQNIPVLEYVTPDPTILEHAYDKPFDILERGRRAIGLDLLIKMNESGVAMDSRLEDLHDLLGKIGEGLFNCAERFLAQVEGLLVTDQGRRQAPIIKRPVSYSIRTPQILKVSAESALPADKLTKYLEYIKAEYKNDPVQMRIQTLSVLYSPLLLLDTAEIQQRLVTAYTDNDLKKRDYAVYAFWELSGQSGFMNWSTADAFRRADLLLSEMGILTIPGPALP